LEKNLEIFCPKSPKIVTSKGLTIQCTCIREQIKRMPKKELYFFFKCVTIKLSVAGASKFFSKC
jgi:hypothetical protein